MITSIPFDGDYLREMSFAALKKLFIVAANEGKSSILFKSSEIGEEMEKYLESKKIKVERNLTSVFSKISW